MTEFGKRLLESAQQALEYAKGTAKPGSYRVSVYEDGELQKQPDAKKLLCKTRNTKNRLQLRKCQCKRKAEVNYFSREQSRVDYARTMECQLQSSPTATSPT